MQSQPFALPFLNRPIAPSSQNYFKSMQSRFFPNFQPFSMTSFLLLANIIIFILIHVLYSPSSYSHFLNWPSSPALDKWLLDIQLVKSNKFYIYECFTAMFLHQNYLHILGNTIFGLFIMYEMQASWRLSIPLGIVAGFLANCLAVLSLQGRLLGFSGVLVSYVGMIIFLYASHYSYLQTRIPRQSLCILMFMMIFLAITAVGLGSSVLIHLFGFAMGALLAAGFYPRHMQSCIAGGSNVDKLLKIGAVAIGVVIVVLAVLL